MKFILASKSPRRKELLALLDIDFEIVSADIDETVNDSLPVCDEISRLSYNKAAAVANSAADNSVIISADTVVVLDGKILGKPKDQNDAICMLKKLSGNTHDVVTCVTVFYNNRHLTRSVITQVSFRELCDKEILNYVRSDDCMDKAGAYGIQGRASKFVSKINGDYFNVVGLPVCTLYTMLKELGINLEE